MKRKQLPQIALRRLILAWLTAVTIEFLLVIPRFTQITDLAKMSLVRVLLLTALFFGLLWLSKWETAERWAIPAVGWVLVVASLSRSFTVPFFWVCALILACLVVYAWKGWNAGESPAPSLPEKRKKTAAAPAMPWNREHPWFLAITAALALAFFAFLSAWGVSRVRIFFTPSYDFGIFSQMFHSMRTKGIPLTTLERDGVLSHFAVHMSPIYYLMLPIYALFPYPATLQVLQAAVLASSVIPLWLIGKHHRLPPMIRTLLCALLLLYPALSGGAGGYDLHENCFLTPCLLWLLYGIDKKKLWLVALSALLTLAVKEDAAVYVAVVGLYLMVRSLLHKDTTGIITGAALLAVSLGWFFAVTHYLATKGDGVMTYRYDNFMYDGSSSLLTVVKSVVLCPMKAVYECVDPEKLKFLAQTMLPLLCLPLITRRYERYLLLIPYALVNLMSDYTYQHDIFFQYTFGSTACLIYLTAVNLADIKPDWTKLCTLGAALIICSGFFGNTVADTAFTNIGYNKTFEGYYDSIRETLDTIPKDASVSSTTFYTTYLSQRDILYDVGYCSQEHLLSTDYVVINLTDSTTAARYGSIEALLTMLENRGYTLYQQLGDIMVIYERPQ